MKFIRFLLSCILAAYVFAFPTLAQSPSPHVSAECAVLLEPASGTVLYEKNAEETHRIASTTKLMTALVCAESIAPDEEVTIVPEWTHVEGSSMYLRARENYTCRELLTGLLLASGNDAALAIAGTFPGGEAAFLTEMNAKARSLGMENTHFSNPHGLDAPDHYSTAADLAKLMQAVLEQEELRLLLAMPESTVHGVCYVNHNKLLRRCTGVIGGKTGYTKAAGRCLVSACERHGMTLVCVTLNDPDDWSDHEALYDWAFSEYTAFGISSDTVLADIPVIDSVCMTRPVSVAETVHLCLPAEGRIDFFVSCAPFIFASDEDETVGAAEIVCAGRPVFRCPLICHSGN